MFHDNISNLFIKLKEVKEFSSFRPKETNSQHNYLYLLFRTYGDI
jgi:hypothetical protein